MASNSKTLLRAGLVLLASAALTACASVTPKPKPAPDNPTVSALTAAANQVSQQLELLNSANHSQRKAHIYAIPHVGALSQKITLAWSGPIEPAVKSVAQLLGFHFLAEGDPPPVPRIVSVHAEHVPAFAVLQNIGWQSGAQVGIIVRPSRQLIMLAYPGYKGVGKGGS